MYQGVSYELHYSKLQYWSAIRVDNLVGQGHAFVVFVGWCPFTSASCFVKRCKGTVLSKNIFN